MLARNDQDKTHTFQVHCPVEKRLLHLLRRFVVSVAEEVGFGWDEISKIEMAVDEACSNVVLHAYDHLPGDSDDRVIDVSISLEPRALTIKISDQGHAEPERFNQVHSLRDYQQLNVGRRHYSGLGVMIMKEFMDEVEFTTSPTKGTVVTLKKFHRSAA